MNAPAELAEFFANTYRPLRLRGRSPNTVRLYGCTLRAFGRWLGRAATLADLDELVLSRYLEQRATECSPYTAEKERTQLLALAGLAWERRLLDTKPSVPQAPLPDRVPLAWSVDDMRRLFGAAAALPGERHGVRVAAVLPALVSLQWDCGERIGACLETLRADYKRPDVLIRAEARKGRKRDRVYRVSGHTCDLLDALPDIDGRLIPWPWTRGMLYRRMGQAVAAAGLGSGRRLKFHAIRRTTASHFKAAGGDATAMLDHSSPRITSKFYLDPRIADTGARPCDVLPPIAAGNVSAPILAGPEPRAARPRRVAATSDRQLTLAGWAP